MVSFSCLTVAITVVLQLLLVDHYAIEHASEQARLRMHQLSWQMRDSLDRTLEQAVRDVYLLSALPQLRHPADPAAARQILENLQHHFNDYAWIGIAGPDGKVLAATGGMLENRDVSARPWFHTGEQGVTAADYHPAVLLGKLLPRATDPWRFVDIAGPIHDTDGSLRGVLAIHLSWAWARRLAHDLLTPAQRDIGAEIIVVRSDGVVLLGPDDILEKRISTESLTLAQQGKTGAVTTLGISVDFFSCSYLDVSVRRVRFACLCIQHAMTLKAGFPHSEICGSKCVCSLPAAYRKLLRPSSPVIAKASTMCTYSLVPITLAPA
jgi:hypothetical protein